MCGVIVVDAGRSRPTNLGRDAYIMIIAWISSWLFEVLTLFAVCLLGSGELWVYDQIYLFIHESYWSLLWSLICMITYRLVFLLRYLGFFGQLDLFILQWEEVLCSGFDLTVLDPSDRRGTNTYVSLLLRIKRWVYFYINRSCLHHVIVLIALLHFSMNLIH